MPEAKKTIDITLSCPREIYNRCTSEGDKCNTYVALYTIMEGLSEHGMIGCQPFKRWNE